MPGPCRTGGQSVSRSSHRTVVAKPTPRSHQGESDMRTGLLSLILVVFALMVAEPVSATQPEAVTIETSRLRGAPGSFSATGGIVDAGTFSTLSVHPSAAGAPAFLIIHATYEFVGERGTFVIRTQ